MRQLSFIAFGLAGLLSIGCQNARFPRLIGPAPTSVQRQNAQVFDPYAQVTAGSMDNTTTDIRPRDFTAPRSESVRTQQSPFARFSRWGKGN